MLIERQGCGKKPFTEWIVSIVNVKIQILVIGLPLSEWDLNDDYSLGSVFHGYSDTWHHNR